MGDKDFAGITDDDFSLINELNMTFHLMRSGYASADLVDAARKRLSEVSGGELTPELFCSIIENG